MSVESTIQSKLLESLAPEVLQIENESHNHGGPATESHFKLTVVADGFKGITAVKRHQKVYAVLADELAGSVHALALHLYTPEEWNSRESAPASPDCRGGSSA